MNKVFAPWSLDEIDNLNKRQKIFHPYTCGDCGKDLIACVSGWRCSDVECKYRQNWAHKQDANGFTLKVFQGLYNLKGKI